MIDHDVMVGGEDVSGDVTEIQVQQTIETDSDPGKITLTLANPHQKYRNHWAPQKTAMRAVVKNWVYESEKERWLASGRAEEDFLIFTGHLTDLKADAHQAIVQGECDMGHLSDALPKDHEGIDTNISAKECLTKVLSWHTDEPITLEWDPDLKDKVLDKITYNADMTYQDVVEDIRSLVGGLAYFDEKNILHMISPTTNFGVVDVDPFVINPEETTSIMGRRNIVVVIGNQSLSPSDSGATTPGSVPIIGYAEDLDSIDEIGPLLAPVEYAYNIKTQAEADLRAKHLLEFYKIYKNAETKIKVAGLVPYLQQIVTYSPFEPISDEELAKAKEAFEKRRKELQDAEDARAIQQDRLPRTIELSSKIRGIVIGKTVTYSINGLEAELTLSPGMLDMEAVITDEDVESDSGETGGTGQAYPFEED